MRIPTSKGAIAAQFPDLYEKISKDLGGEQENEGRWVWIWKHKEGVVPRSWRLSEKKDPKFYVAAGFREKHATLFLEVSIGRSKSVLPLMSSGKYPMEVLTFFERRALNSPTSGWKGATIEIWQPLHQQHPGLAEHAVIGAFEDAEEVMFLLSDNKNPISSNIWQVYKLSKDKGVAIPMLFLFDREQQKLFLSAFEGEFFELRGKKVRRLKENEWMEVLGGKMRFSWSLSSATPGEKIPERPRKFKLGETVAPIERECVQLRVSNPLKD